MADKVEVGTGTKETTKNWVFRVFLCLFVAIDLCFTRRGFSGRRLNRGIREIRGNPTSGLLPFRVFRVFRGYSSPVLPLRLAALPSLRSLCSLWLDFLGPGFSVTFEEIPHVVVIA